LLKQVEKLEIRIKRLFLDSLPYKMAN
jgi:hypothetical protein